MKDNKKRCFGSAPGKEFYAEYHDKEWGVPVYDDRHLFEMLILEGAQAGLSWETILKRREEYRKAFYHFDPAKVAKMTNDELNGLLQNHGVILKTAVRDGKMMQDFEPESVPLGGDIPHVVKAPPNGTDSGSKDCVNLPPSTTVFRIIRNRLKIYAARQNALVFLQIQKEFGSFSKYVWDFVDAKPIVTRRKSLKDIPASTPISDVISKDLKKRGMTFVGPTIIYAFMQAVGLVDDHLDDCWCSRIAPGRNSS